MPMQPSVLDIVIPVSEISKDISEVDPAKYPMIAKMMETSVEARGVLSDFFEFLRDNGYVRSECPNTEVVLAGFYQLDIVELMREQDRLYQELHEKLEVVR